MTNKYYKHIFTINNLTLKISKSKKTELCNSMMQVRHHDREIDQFWHVLQNSTYDQQSESIQYYAFWINWQ